MYQVTAKYLDAIRNSHTKAIRVDHRNVFTGTTSTLAYTGVVGGEDAAPPWVTGGDVTVDATSNVRRSLSLTVPPREALWNSLDTVGGEITVSTGVDFRDGTHIEWVPVGVFIVDVDAIDYGGGGALTIQTAPDRWGKVQKVKLAPGQRSSVASNAAWQEIKRLVEGAWAAGSFPGWSRLDTSATTQVGALLWDGGDREAAILNLCADNALECFFDASGRAVLRPVPSLSAASVPVFTVDAGASGVLLGASRTRDRTRAYNAIELDTAASDIVFNTVVVQNTNRADPLSVYGPLQYQAVQYSSATLRNSAQARAAGLAMLSKSTGVAKQLSLTVSQCDALDAGDVIEVLLPRTDLNLPRPSEMHIIDSLTVQFDPSNAMDIQTRSTVPTTLGG